MAEQIRAVRGMNDIVPPAAERWRALEDAVRTVVERYGYREIRLPLLEHSGVFERSIGDATDIVQKEMYTFADRNGDRLSLRPEGTAGCVRAALEGGLLHQGAQRLWYAGPMFRHERPQKGRYRQFHQIGVETFGLPGPDIDVELLLMTARIWAALGLGRLRLELNTLGQPDERAAYRERLTAYFSAHTAALDEDSRHRLTRNPLRILDSKNPDMKDLIAGAPSLTECLSEASRAEFSFICEALAAAGVGFQVNARLVRGLDYYSKMVFEWVTDELGAQGTVCAGGRYDGLVELMGGRTTPAIGWAMGLERLLELLALQAAAEPAREAELYVIGADAPASHEGLLLAERARDLFPAARVLCHCGGGSLKAQLKRADRSGAIAALIIGEEELATGTVSLKPLRGQGTQQRVDRAELASVLRPLLAACAVG